MAYSKETAIFMDKVCVNSGSDLDHFANGNLTKAEVLKFKALWAIQLNPANGYNSLMPELEALYDDVIDRTETTIDEVIPPKYFNPDQTLGDASISDLDGAYKEKLDQLDPGTKALILQTKEQ